MGEIGSWKLAMWMGRLEWHMDDKAMERQGMGRARAVAAKEERGRHSHCCVRMSLMHQQWGIKDSNKLPFDNTYCEVHEGPQRARCRGGSEQGERGGSVGGRDIY